MYKTQVGFCDILVNFSLKDGRVRRTLLKKLLYVLYQQHWEKTCFKSKIKRNSMVTPL